MERNLERFCAIAEDAIGTNRVRTIVEIGARDCRETLGFHRMFPDAIIYAFECNPATLPQCRAAVRGRQAITLVENAVSDVSGPVTFYAIDQQRTQTGSSDGNPGASSLLQASDKYELEKYVQEAIPVQAIRLDEYLQSRGIDRVDLLWMDIQGAELMALEGAGRRLETVKLIHTEVEFQEIYSGQPLFKDVRAFLEGRGFAFLGFTIYSRHSADAVFANRRLISAARRLLAVGRNRYLLVKRITWLRHRAKRFLVGT